MIGNSAFQAMLCGVMCAELFVSSSRSLLTFLAIDRWGMDRFERPAWTTGWYASSASHFDAPAELGSLSPHSLIPLSFGCMIGASIMIWIYGERTKRSVPIYTPFALL